jgi:hypothetical protein
LEQQRQNSDQAEAGYLSNLSPYHNHNNENGDDDGQIQPIDVQTFWQEHFGGACPYHKPGMQVHGAKNIVHESQKRSVERLVNKKRSEKTQLRMQRLKENHEIDVYFKRSHAASKAKGKDANVKLKSNKKNKTKSESKGKHIAQSHQHTSQIDTDNEDAMVLELQAKLMLAQAGRPSTAGIAESTKINSSSGNDVALAYPYSPIHLSKDIDYNAHTLPDSSSSHSSSIDRNKKIIVKPGML